MEEERDLRGRRRSDPAAVSGLPAARCENERGSSLRIDAGEELFLQNCLCSPHAAGRGEGRGPDERPPSLVDIGDSAIKEMWQP